MTALPGSAAPSNGATRHADTKHDTATRARRHFVRASAIGGLLGTAVFVWMLTRGTFDLFQWQRVGDFYDLQAHSLLDGHLSVNGLRLGVESFTVNGTAHIYQGPIPAVLRLPLLAVAGNGLDGRLTQTSMLLAFLVVVFVACRLHWRARTMLRGPVSLGRGEAMLTGLFTFALAGGSALVFEASRAWVYHEALLWGCAFALAAIDLLISYIVRPKVWTLAAVSLLATCALLTRASVGLGPVIGLGLVAIGTLIIRLGDRPSTVLAKLQHLGWLAPDPPHERSRGESPWLIALAAAAPVAAYALVNLLKFGTLFSVPFYGQGFSQVDPGRQAFLAENGGTLFGLKFIPTTVLQYLRPDALRFTSLFPFVDFATFPGPIIGDVRFDLFDRSSSLPTSMPFFFVLALVGLWVLFIRRASWQPGFALRSFRVPTIAAAASAATILPFGFIAQRYLADFVPLLVIASVIGIQSVHRRSAAPRRAWVVPSIVGLVVAALFMTWVNVGLALRYQRQWSYNLDAGVIAGFIGFQSDVADALGTPPVRVERGSELPPAVGQPGRLFVIGDCDGLYLSDGMETNAVKSTPWNGVERTAATGHFRLRARFPERPVGTRVPLFSTGTRARPNILVAEYAPNGEILFEYNASDPEFTRRYVPFPIEPDREHTIDLAADWRVGLLTVTVDDVVVLDSLYTYRGTDFRLGENPFVPGVAKSFPGTIDIEKTTAPLCKALTADRTDSGR